jgi:hypothetical protein
MNLQHRPFPDEPVSLRRRRRSRACGVPEHFPETTA